MGASGSSNSSVAKSTNQKEKLKSSKTSVQTSEEQTLSLEDHNAAKAHCFQQIITARNVVIGEGEVHTADSGCTSTTNISHAQEIGSTADSIQKDASIQKSIKLINQDSCGRTYTTVTEGFQTENVSEPESDFVVFPQIAEVPKFYKGIDKEKRHYESDLEASGRANRKQYFKERILEFGQSVHKTLSFNDLIELISTPKNKSKQDVIGIFSQAGSGKTTIMKRTTAAIMERSGITSESYFQSAGNDDFQIVINRDFKSMQQQSKTTLKNILFDGYLKDDAAEHMYDWIIENQSKVALIFDGYDQASWTITEEDTETSLGPLDPASTQAVMGNLLSRKLLPNVFIIFSSREFKAASLPCDSRPEKILTLMGFNDSDAENLFNQLVSTNKNTNEPSLAEMNVSDNQSTQQQCDTDLRPWTILHSKSSLLLSFLKIPVFLLFAAIIFNSGVASMPSTVTGLLCQILKLLHSAKIVRQRRRISQIIGKLKQLAHDGMVRGYVLFKPEDFKNHGLKVEEVSDLLLGVPKSTSLNQCLMESDFFLFFCHQSIQEFLSACFITEMDLEDFQKFVDNNIHQPRWSVVRRFVFGIVYNLSDESFVTIDNREEKKAILRGSLTSKVANVKGFQLLEIFLTLYESNDDDLIKFHIHSIDLRSTPLSTNEVKLLSYILSRCSHKIERLNLNECGLNDELLGIIKIADVYIGSLHLQKNQISFAALNCFLENLQVGELRLHKDFISGEGGLNWKNVSAVNLEVAVFADLDFTNERDSIQMNSSEFRGIFNKNNKTLEIEVEDRAIELDRMVLLFITVAEKLLQPTSLNFNNNIMSLNQQYLEYEALEKMLNWNVNFKIPKVVLNCRDASKISPTVIRSFKEKYQVDVLDIAVRIHQSSIGENFYESTSIKIHVWERVEDQTGIKDLAANLKEIKTDNLTVVSYNGYAPATEDIVMLINSCQSKVFTLVYDEDVDAMEGLDRSKLMEASESLSVKLNLQTITELLLSAWFNLYQKVLNWD